MKWTEIDKKQLKIYMAIAFGIPFLSGILMWYGSSQGRNMGVFPNVQMLYPAAGVMVLLLATKKKEEVPRRFFYFVSDHDCITDRMCDWKCVYR